MRPKTFPSGAVPVGMVTLYSYYCYRFDDFCKTKTSNRPLLATWRQVSKPTAAFQGAPRGGEMKRGALLGIPGGESHWRALGL